MHLVGFYYTNEGVFNFEMNVSCIFFSLLVSLSGRMSYNMLNGTGISLCCVTYTSDIDDNAGHYAISEK